MSQTAAAYPGPSATPTTQPTETTMPLPRRMCGARGIVMPRGLFSTVASRPLPLPPNPLVKLRLEHQDAQSTAGLALLE
jgi:hypothetical protein